MGRVIPLRPGLRPVSAHVPHGKAWTRMSDHLPLIAELAL